MKLRQEWWLGQALAVQPVPFNVHGAILHVVVVGTERFAANVEISNDRCEVDPQLDSSNRR